MNKVSDFFKFPELINEVSARLVATGVLILSIFSLIFIIRDNNISYVLLSMLIYGFLARVSSGPKISPLALLVTKIIVPKLNFREKIFFITINFLLFSKSLIFYNLKKKEKLNKINFLFYI